MRHLLFLGIVFAAFHTGSSNPGFCNLPHDAGEGTNINYEVYYDATDDLCYPFIYNGEGGNDNRFRDEAQCMKTCSPNAEAIYPTNETAVCSLKKLAGGNRCGNTILRYYYDAIHDKCVKFFWTGCNGNGNRFHSAEECYNTCIGVHEEGEDAMEEEPDTPIAIILGVLLGLVILGVIITAVVLAVKSKNHKKKRGKKDTKADTPLQELGA